MEVEKEGGIFFVRVERTVRFVSGRGNFPFFLTTAKPVDRSDVGSGSETSWVELEVSMRSSGSWISVSSSVIRGENLLEKYESRVLEGGRLRRRSRLDM